MAFLMESFEFEPCECCGSMQCSIRSGVRTHWRYCYHGIVRDDPYPQPKHAVKILGEDRGWRKRFGRFPICPDHKHHTDEEWTGTG